MDADRDLGRGGFTVTVKRGTRTVTRLDNTGKERPAEVKTGVPEPVHLLLTADGSLAVLGGGGGAIAVIDLRPKADVRVGFRLGTNLNTLAVSTDGKTLAGGDGKEVLLCAAATGKVSRTLKQKAEVAGLCFSPDGMAVAVGTADGKCRLWSVEDGEVLWEASLGKDKLSCVAFFPGAKKLATGGWDGRVCVVDAKAGEALASHQAHGKGVNNVTVSPDGKYVASCGRDRALRVWDAEGEKDYATEKVGLEAACVAFSKTHVFVGEGEVLKTFDLKEKKLSDLRKPK